jgi:hypothetical protein
VKIERLTVNINNYGSEPQQRPKLKIKKRPLSGKESSKQSLLDLGGSLPQRNNNEIPIVSASKAKRIDESPPVTRNTPIIVNSTPIKLKVKSSIVRKVKQQAISSIKTPISVSEACNNNEISFCEAPEEIL